MEMFRVTVQYTNLDEKSYDIGKDLWVNHLNKALDEDKTVQRYTLEVAKVDDAILSRLQEDWDDLVDSRADGDKQAIERDMEKFDRDASFANYITGREVTINDTGEVEWVQTDY